MKLPFVNSQSHWNTVERTMRIIALLEHSLPVPQWTPTDRQFLVLEAFYMITIINIGRHSQSFPCPYPKYLLPLSLRFGQGLGSLITHFRMMNVPFICLSFVLYEPDFRLLSEVTSLDPLVLVLACCSLSLCSCRSAPTVWTHNHQGHKAIWQP